MDVCPSTERLEVWATPGDPSMRHSTSVPVAHSRRRQARVCQGVCDSDAHDDLSAAPRGRTNRHTALVASGSVARVARLAWSALQSLPS
jgi:hypothetical protein